MEHADPLLQLAAGHCLKYSELNFSLRLHFSLKMKGAELLSSGSWLSVTARLAGWLSSHLASPDLVDIEPAGCPAAAPGVVVLGPQVVAGQRGVEHPRCEIYPALWRCKMFSYPTSHLTLKQIFVPGMKYNGKVCYVERSHLSQVSASHLPVNSDVFTSNTSTTSTSQPYIGVV